MIELRIALEIAAAGWRPSVCQRDSSPPDRRRREPGPRLGRGRPCARRILLRFLLGLHHETEGDLDEAIASYQRAGKLDPGSPQIPAILASLFARMNRPQEAIAASEAALRVEPDNPEAHRVLGTVYAAVVQADDRTGGGESLSGPFPISSVPRSATILVPSCCSPACI